MTRDTFDRIRDEQNAENARKRAAKAGRFISGFCGNVPGPLHKPCLGHDGQGRACECASCPSPHGERATDSEAASTPAASDPTLAVGEDQADAPVSNDPTALEITEPGVYYDLPAEQYHAQHEWLSWSRMKYLMPPSTPAHFKASLRAGEERKRHFDLGKVVHTLALGDGDEFVVVQALTRAKESYDAKSYDLVSAQAHRDEIYAEGKVPILRHELEAAKAMAASIRQHPVANALLSNGKPEVSLFWVDPATGVRCRARVDWLPDAAEGRRMIVPDLKTAVSAAPSEFSKAAANFAYFGQQQHYLDGIKALGIDPDPAFLFVTVEKQDPWLVSVGQLADRDDLALARAAVDHCRRLYAECTANGSWPGYGQGVNDLTLPQWLHYSLEGALS